MYHSSFIRAVTASSCCCCNYSPNEKDGIVSGNYPQSPPKPQLCKVLFATPQTTLKLTPTTTYCWSNVIRDLSTLSTNCLYSRGSIYVQKITSLAVLSVFSVCLCLLFFPFFFKSFYFYFLIAQDMVSACSTNPFLGRTVFRSSCLDGYTMSINSVNWYLGREHRCALIW